MERDDIAVITEGHCQSLDKCLWNLESIKSKNGEKYHQRFRCSKRKDIDVETADASETESRYEYEEVDKGVSTRVEDYFGYLERREEVLEKSPREGVSTSSEMRWRWTFSMMLSTCWTMMLQ